jgi:hypothetical protein
MSNELTQKRIIDIIILSPHEPGVLLRFEDSTTMSLDDYVSAVVDERIEQRLVSVMTRLLLLVASRRNTHD